MRTHRNLALIAVFALFNVSPAAGATVTFEDLTPPDCNNASIPSSYAGLTWSNFGVLDSSPCPNYASSGYDNGAVSGDNVAFNFFGDPSAISGGTFTFNSAYFTAAHNDGLNLTISGFQGATQLFTTTLVLNTTTTQLFTANWSGIDRLTFASSGGVDVNPLGTGTQFAMDDFTFNSAVAAEPASLLLLGTGLLGAGVRRWRQKRI